ncbi:MAG: hypothetical protein NW226_04375 [Microscillaceae bacterium]|nr:hypothetical protein [Microscillaceae bacterium]
MSRNHNIDRLFCKIVQKHEERYDPRDWEKMHTILREEGLCREKSRLVNFLKIFSRVVYSMAILLLLLIPSSIYQNIPTDEKNLTQFKVEKNNPNLIDKTPTNSPKTQTKNLSTSKSIIESANLDIESATNKNTVSTTFQTKIFPKLEIYKVEQATQTTIVSIFNSDYLLYDENLKLSDFIDREFARVATISVPDSLHQDSAFVANTQTDSLAQDNQQNRVFHLGLFYPLSNQGKKSLEHQNSISVHALVGSSASLKGFEISGLGNLETSTVSGVQVAGLFNHTPDSLKGLQLSGLVNVSGNQGNAVQVAGLVNVSGTEPSSTTTVSPDQKKFRGQISGLVNVDHFNNKNLQMSGLFNRGAKITGVQFSGLANVANRVEGVQIGGLVNVAQRVKGVQIGLINITDTLEGFSIGLINVVKRNAYRKLEFWGTESFHTNLGLKLGTRKFYNIFALGSQISAGTFRWGLGYGFGTQLNMSAKHYLNLDLISYHVNEERKFTRKLNLLNQFKVSLSREFGSGIGIYGGPTLNLLVSDFKNSDNSIGSQIAPWTFYENYTKERGTKIKIWGGFNFGIRF